MGTHKKIDQQMTMFLLVLHSTAALLLAPQAPLQIAKSPAAPRAAVSAMFGIDNGKDLRKVAAATLASVVILASPTAALAKGGGHGGGGGGGGGHSYSSSHSSAPQTRSLHSYSRYASPKAASVRSSLPSQGRRGSSSSSRRRRNGYSFSSSSQGTSAPTLAPP